jgi:hypothetical protein
VVVARHAGGHGEGHHHEGFDFISARRCHCTNTGYSVVPGPVIGLSAPNTALRQGDGDR